MISKVIIKQLDDGLLGCSPNSGHVFVEQKDELSLSMRGVRPDRGDLHETGVSAFGFTGDPG